MRWSEFRNPLHMREEKNTTETTFIFLSIRSRGVTVAKRSLCRRIGGWVKPIMRPHYYCCHVRVCPVQFSGNGPIIDCVPHIKKKRTKGADHTHATSTRRKNAHTRERVDESHAIIREVWRDGQKTTCNCSRPGFAQTPEPVESGGWPGEADAEGWHFP